MQLLEVLATSAYWLAVDLLLNGEWARRHRHRWSPQLQAARSTRVPSSPAEYRSGPRDSSSHMSHSRAGAAAKRTQPTRGHRHGLTEDQQRFDEVYDLQILDILAGEALNRGRSRPQRLEPP